MKKEEVNEFEVPTAKKFIAPGCVGVIWGNKVTARIVSESDESYKRPCLKCVFENAGLCFESHRDDKLRLTIQKQLPTRPCCFANDKENLSKKPLYFVKA